MITDVERLRARWELDGIRNAVCWGFGNYRLMSGASVETVRCGCWRCSDSEAARAVTLQKIVDGVE